MKIGISGKHTFGALLELDKAQRTIVEHRDLDRQLLLHGGDHVAHQHGKAAVAGDHDHLPVRERCFRPKPAAQSARHRAMEQACEGAILTGRGNVPQRVDGGGSIVDRPDRVGVSLFGNGLDHELRVHRLADVRIVGALVELCERLVPEVEHIDQERVIVVLPQVGQERIDRGCNIADGTDLDRVALAQVTRIDVDLDDAGIVGIELPPGEAAPQEQQRLTVQDGLVTALHTDHAGHTHAIRVIMLHE